MKRTLITDVAKSASQTVKVSGWVNTIRNQKSVQFVVVRDRTGLVQVTNIRKDNPEIAMQIDNLTSESVVEITGSVVANEHVKLGQVEIIPECLTILSLAPSQLPIDDHTEQLDLRLDWRFLDLRRPANTLIFEIQTTAEHAMRTYWLNNGFIEIQSPKLMGHPSESGAELFKVGYFGKNAYLAQSPQFYKQMGMAAGFERVFEIGPVFRANPSFTSRHDTEFTSVDVEISFIDSHEDVMTFEENWLHFVLGVIKDKHGTTIKEIFGTEVTVPTIPFPRVTMAEAHALLAEQGHTVPAEGKGDLDPEGERILARVMQEKYGHEFVFVTDYPISVRPFYHMRPDDNPNVTKSFDLIWKGLEVTTGAQREHRYDILVRQVLEKGLTTEPLQFYLDFFKYGCPPHGGFGFGLTRMLMVLLGISNVREVTYLYRGPNRLTP